jgi:hypothetical protein
MNLKGQQRERWAVLVTVPVSVSVSVTVPVEATVPGRVARRALGQVSSAPAMSVHLAVVTASTLLFVQSVSGGALADSATSTPLASPCPPVAQSEGRSELVFLKAELGPAYVDTVALKDRELLDAGRDATSGLGVMHGVAVGLRAREFWAAARYRRGNFSDWDLWTLGGEAGVTLSFGRLAPRKGDNLPRVSSTDPNERPIVSQALDGSGTGLGAALSFTFGLHY